MLLDDEYCLEHCPYCDHLCKRSDEDSWYCRYCQVSFSFDAEKKTLGIGGMALGSEEITQRWKNRVYPKKD